ncbi:MAG: hypothetical protein GXO78_05785 [Calditrichaeota bacterium]|nr:hypothetical protein [Calditrichota bacterium]
MRRMILGMGIGLMLIVPLAAISPGYLLELSPDASSLALAGATQALPSGALDIFINPALIEQDGGLRLALSNFVEYRNYQYMALGVTFPFRKYGTMGVGILGLHVPGIQQYDALGMYLGEFSHYNAAVFLSFARKILPWRFGVNLKFLRSGFLGLSKNRAGNGVGMDLGVHYAVYPGVQLGVVYRLAFRVFWGDGYSETIPKSLNLALYWSPKLLGSRFLGSVLGIQQVKGEPAKLNLGIRLAPFRDENKLERLVIYGGMGTVNIETRNLQIDLADYSRAEGVYSTGITLKVGTPGAFVFVLDYCFWWHRVLGNRHLLTTKLEF